MVSLPADREDDPSVVVSPAPDITLELLIRGAAISPAQLEAMAEHHRDMQRREAELDRLGLIFAFALAVLGLAASTFLIFTGHAVAGGFLVSAEFAALVTAFIRRGRT